jgi:hypothetical protein
MSNNYHYKLINQGPLLINTELWSMVMEFFLDPLVEPEKDCQ